MTGLLRPAAKRETDERALNASGSRSPIVYLFGTAVRWLAESGMIDGIRPVPCASAV